MTAVRDWKSPAKPVVVIKARFADGGVHVRKFWVENAPDPERMTIERWMLEPRRWQEHPLDPVSYGFLVREGFEQLAREWIDAL